MSDETRTMGEITRWMSQLEQRVGAMHGENRAAHAEARAENRAGLAKIETQVGGMADALRVQNGTVMKIQERTSLLELRTQTVEAQQRGTDEEIDRIQSAATAGATAAATQAIQDTAPTAKRMTAIAAAAFGATSGGIWGVTKVVEAVAKAWGG